MTTSKAEPTIEELKAKDSLTDEEQARLIKYLVDQQDSKP